MNAPRSSAPYLSDGHHALSLQLRLDVHWHARQGRERVGHGRGSGGGRMGRKEEAAARTVERRSSRARHQSVHSGCSARSGCAWVVGDLCLWFGWSLAGVSGLCWWLEGRRRACIPAVGQRIAPTGSLSRRLCYRTICPDRVVCISRTQTSAADGPTGVGRRPCSSRFDLIHPFTSNRQPQGGPSTIAHSADDAPSVSSSLTQPLLRRPPPNSVATAAGVRTRPMALADEDRATLGGTPGIETPGSTPSKSEANNG